ncbi:MAG: GNAT family N-acetyltransferase [Geminicoccaceae bacterium]|mgnify:CR=1 FL=1|nr:GNAT family N-acetyltransferase [Geminicoccaceae bacterium]
MTADRITIQILPAELCERALPDLVTLLLDAVASGASVGFLASLDEASAEAWWRETIAEIAQGRRTIVVARERCRIVGTVHLSYSWKPNARHRAEVQKLMVLRRMRRRGLARRLMAAAEEEALKAGRLLLMLDTETASPARDFYAAQAWIEMGVVPGHAARPTGELSATTFFYKLLRERDAR